MHKHTYGFTIVELLIVIVVIGILAAISIVAYNGVSNSANDAAVKSDMRNNGQKLAAYRAERGIWPVGHAQLESIGVKATKNAYGEHYDLSGNLYNLVYCRMPDGTGDIALVGRSKSGAMFSYTKDGVRDFTGRWTGTSTTCTDALGTAPTAWNAGYRDWLFELGAWRSYL